FFWSLVISYITFFLFNATAPTAFYTLSLHDALPILSFFDFTLPKQNVELFGLLLGASEHQDAGGVPVQSVHGVEFVAANPLGQLNRKSTRLNSSHVKISYAVFCLKKKNKSLYVIRSL